MGRGRAVLVVILTFTVGTARAQRLTPQRALELGLTRPMLQRALERPGSKVVAGLVASVRDVERRHGDNDRVLAPRDLEHAPPAVKRFMDAVYARTGRQNLSLGEIESAAPAAIADLVGNPWDGRARHVDPLHLAATRETVDVLAEQYHREVTDGGRAPHEFVALAKLNNSMWARLRRALPKVFPTPAVNRRPATRELTAADVTRLSRRWKSEVVTRRLTAREFAVREGLQTWQLQRLQADAKAFPPPLSAGPRKPGEFVRDETMMKIVAAKANELFAATPLTRREDVCNALNADPAFVARFGRMTPARYGKLTQRDRQGRFPPIYDLSVILPRLADDVRTLYASNDDKLRPSEIVGTMRVVHPRFNRNRLAQLRAEFPDLDREADRTVIPRGPGNGGSVRASRSVVELFRLLVDLAPPWTPEPKIGDAMNQLLVERGIEPYPSGVHATASLRHAAKGLRMRDRWDQVAKEIYLEYARAAPAGTDEFAIWRAMRKDYPQLSHAVMARLRPLWKDVPRVGLGEAKTPVRYRGGWDPARIAATAPLDVAERAQYARIPLRLPLLDELVDGLADGQPLNARNVLMVSHLLGSTYPLVHALRKAGAQTGRFTIVGTPYGTNRAVHSALLDDGFDVRVPALSTKAYRDEVRKALDDVVARHRQNGQPVIVLDDGGLVTELLHADLRYADVRGAFKIVEQTTRGIEVAEQSQLEVAIINVARSRAKRAEGRYIGRAVAAKVSQALARVDRSPEDADAVVFGFGVVGSAVARELKGHKARVTVVETNPVRAARAAKLGYRVVSEADALRTADIVIGATGKQSLSLELLRLLKDGAVIASASSKQVEFDMEGLGAAASRRTLIAAHSPLVKLPTARYRLGGAEITVLGDGWPINFDGDVEDIPAEDIQLTRAAMFLGAMQAAALRHDKRGNRRLIPLDPVSDKQLVARHRELRRGKPSGAIGDPDRWRDVLVDLGGRL
jgi:adenosylhomocysteinase